MSKKELLDSFDKEFTVYERRCDELKTLLDKSESRTSKLLFQDALDITGANIKLFLKLSKTAVKFHDDFNKSTKVTLGKFDKELTEMQQKVLDVKNANISKAEKLKIVNQHEQRINILIDEIKVKGALHDLELDMRFKCYDSLRDLLFNQIFRSNSSDFKYDIIIDLFKKVIQKLLPGSEEVETLISINVNERKCQSLSSADRINIYIEEYMDVSKLWYYYAELYLKTLE